MTKVFLDDQHCYPHSLETKTVFSISAKEEFRQSSQNIVLKMFFFKQCGKMYSILPRCYLRRRYKLWQNVTGYHLVLSSPFFYHLEIYRGGDTEGKGGGRMEAGERDREPGRK